MAKTSLMYEEHVQVKKIMKNLPPNYKRWKMATFSPADPCSSLTYNVSFHFN